MPLKGIMLDVRDPLVHYKCFVYLLPSFLCPNLAAFNTCPAFLLQGTHTALVLQTHLHGFFTVPVSDMATQTGEQRCEATGSTTK